MVKSFPRLAGASLVATSAFLLSTGLAASAQPAGPKWVPNHFWQVDRNGVVYGSPSYGSTANLHLSKPIVGITSTRSGNGYWLVGADGGVFSFGDATFHGSLPGLDVTPQKPIVGIATTQSGAGYWLDGSDGGVFTFGNAGFFGSTPDNDGLSIVGPVFPTPDQQGYWLATSSTGSPATAEGFGDVQGCWGGSNQASGAPLPVVVGAAAAGGADWSGIACAV